MDDGLLEYPIQYCSRLLHTRPDTPMTWLNDKHSQSLVECIFMVMASFSHLLHAHHS